MRKIEIQIIERLARIEEQLQDTEKEIERISKRLDKLEKFQWIMLTAISLVLGSIEILPTLWKYY